MDGGEVVTSLQLSTNEYLYNASGVTWWTNAVQSFRLTTMKPDGQTQILVTGTYDTSFQFGAPVSIDVGGGRIAGFIGQMGDINIASTGTYISKLAVVFLSPVSHSYLFLS